MFSKCEKQTRNGILGSSLEKSRFGIKWMQACLLMNAVRLLRKRGMLTKSQEESLVRNINQLRQNAEQIQQKITPKKLHGG